MKNKWSYKNCYNIAKDCKTRNELNKKNRTVYNKVLKNGWINDYDWFIDGHHIKWNYETCFQEAQKYQSRNEFRKGNNGAYSSALKNGWLDDYTWFLKSNLNRLYCLYEYWDNDSNSVYVGITYHIKERHYQHKHGTKKNGKIIYDVVKTFFTKLNKELPQPLIREKNLTEKNAKLLECFYIEKYKNMNINVLNKVKGGSVGGNNGWTKESCYNEAQKYKTKHEFIKKSNGAYKCAWKNKWLNDYDWFVDGHVKWNYETCFKEAQKYQSRSEFKTKNESAYQVALKNKWLDDYTWFIRLIGYWNYETCFQEAQKYKTKTQFQKGSNGAYTCAWKNGWLNNFFPK